MQIPLTRWGTLDRTSGWEEFAEGASATSITDKVLEFKPEVVLGVDWTSLACYRALAATLAARSSAAVPYVYLNYRCGRLPVFGPRVVVPLLPALLSGFAGSASPSLPSPVKQWRWAFPPPDFPPSLWSLGGRERGGERG